MKVINLKKYVFVGIWTGSSAWLEAFAAESAGLIRPLSVETSGRVFKSRPVHFNLKTSMANYLQVIE